MKPKVFEAPEVVVMDKRPALDLSSTVIGRNLNAKELDALPIDRDYRAAVAYVPHSNTSFLGDDLNIGGSSGLENMFVIDGVNVTDGYVGLPSRSTRLPQNFIREVQIKTGGYEAEFGRSTGGIINVITQSGSNNLSGQGYTFFTNNSFAQNPRLSTFDFGQGDFARYDVGVSVGGPIRRDRLWYFLAYDPAFQKQDVQLPGVGTLQDDRTTHQFAGKLTWQAAQRTRVNLVAFGDVGDEGRIDTGIEDFLVPQSLGNPDPFLGNWDTGGYTVSASALHLFTDAFLIEGSVSRAQNRNAAEPATEVGWNQPLFKRNSDGYWEGGFGANFDFRTVRWAGKLTGTLQTGPHRLKAGVEYEDNFLDIDWFWQLPDGSDSYVNQVDDSLFFSNNSAVSDDYAVRAPSAFVQDTWQVSRRIRLKAGLRWDGLYYVVNGHEVSSILDQYQSRVGFSYAPGDIGTQKLFGSYGRFFEQTPTQALMYPWGNLVHVLSAYDRDPRFNNVAPLWTASFGSADVSPPPGDLKGMYIDEFVLGYERQIGASWKTGLSGTYRTLGAAINTAFNRETTSWTLGNPGSGEQSFLTELEREHWAVEVSVSRTEGPWRGTASYVYSQTWGNYPGTYDNEGVAVAPHGSVSFELPSQRVNSVGRLPNDRPHVFKVYGSYEAPFGLASGAFFTWQQGTPLSELGGAEPVGAPWFKHLRERGTFGRTPDIWDLNLRFSYDLSKHVLQSRPVGARLLIDVFHLFSQREPVAFDQVHYFGTDGTSENPNFMKPIAFQPPMTLRIGVESGF
jgi:hypothetical protein